MATFHFRETAKRLFSKESALTVPNLISLLRLLMVPVMLYENALGRYHIVSVLFLISGISDVLDGFIARKTNQVSDLGKVLDPVADKLTQGALLFCLAARHPEVWWLIGLFLFKEILQGITQTLAQSGTEGPISSAKWYGKVCSVVMFVVIILLILFPETESFTGISIPGPWARVLIGLAAVALIVSMVLYVSSNLKTILALLRNKKAADEKQEKTEE